MARGTLWLNVACILTCFDLEKPLDAQGHPLEPSGTYISTLMRYGNGLFHTPDILK